MLQYSYFQRTINVVIRKETKEEYFKDNLWKLYNFYDYGGEFKKHIPTDAKVLTVNIHNLFYVNFNFWDQSFIPELKGSNFSPTNLVKVMKNNNMTYILEQTQDRVLIDENYQSYFDLVYQNDNYKLYKIK